MSNDEAIIGISDHGGWAVLVTMTRNGTIADRRRIDLVDADLPKLPHHHDAQSLPLDEATSLIQRVRASAQRHAAKGLDQVAREISVPIRAVALRVLQPLPSTLPERIRDYRSQNVADWVMYREALAGAAQSRGWSVYWYDAKTALGDACATLGVKSLEPRFVEARRSLGAPWSRDHKLAMAAAIVAASDARVLGERQRGDG